jgi:ABC-type cobalamin transport system ATPase subunit
MLKVTQVSVQHRLNDISFEMHAGECWHVLGQNGAGKSSLFDAISGLIKIESGSIEIDKIDIAHISIADLSLKLAYLQQQYALSFSLKVNEILSFYTGNKVIAKEIEKALSLAPLMSRNFHSLSGGEQQRVHIARCLMQVWHRLQCGEALVLLDEPIQSLDVAYQEKALALFKHIASMGNLVVLSIHDVTTY